jgi:hypothetical protein
MPRRPIVQEAHDVSARQKGSTLGSPSHGPHDSATSTTSEGPNALIHETRPNINAYCCSPGDDGVDPVV